MDQLSRLNRSALPLDVGSRLPKSVWLRRQLLPSRSVFSSSTGPSHPTTMLSKFASVLTSHSLWSKPRDSDISPRTEVPERMFAQQPSEARNPVGRLRYSADLKIVNRALK